MSLILNPQKARLAHCQRKRIVERARPICTSAIEKQRSTFPCSVRGLLARGLAGARQPQRAVLQAHVEREGKDSLLNPRRVVTVFLQRGTWAQLQMLEPGDVVVVIFSVSVRGDDKCLGYTTERPPNNLMESGTTTALTTFVCFRSILSGNEVIASVRSFLSHVRYYKTLGTQQNARVNLTIPCGGHE